MLHTNSKTWPLFLSWPDLPLRRNGLLLLHLRRMGAAVRNIVPERRAQLLAVVGEQLCIVSAALDGGMDHAVVEQVFRDQLGVHMNENAVGSQSLARVAGHSFFSGA